jgi:uncharacterized protein (TIGR03083 family)
MRLHPRYGNQAIITMDATFPHPDGALIEQRARQEHLFGRFGPEHWSAATRCDDWMVRDVVAHLASLNRLWIASISAGLAGAPTEVLTGFDPAVHPARLLDAFAGLDGPAVFDRYRETNNELIDLVTGLSEEEWSRSAESLVGHVAIDRVVEHALWDGWVHEHDIRVPHGLAHEGSPAEVGAVLRYAAVLGPALGDLGIDGFTGTLVVDATDLGHTFTVEVSTSVAVFDRPSAPGTPLLRGLVVELIEGLSLRGPLPADAPDEARSLVAELSHAFC